MKTPEEDTLSEEALKQPLGCDAPSRNVPRWKCLLAARPHQDRICYRAKDLRKGRQLLDFSASGAGSGVWGSTHLHEGDDDLQNRLGNHCLLRRASFLLWLCTISVRDPGVNLKRSYARSRTSVLFATSRKVRLSDDFAIGDRHSFHTYQ